MTQPEGFLHPHYPSHVYKIKRIFMELNKHQGLSMIGWKTLCYNGVFVLPDQTLYYLFSIWKRHWLWFVYMLMIYWSLVQILNLLGSYSTTGVRKYFENLGEFNYFLSLEVTTSNKGLHLSQTKYIRDLLKKAQMLESKGCQTSKSSIERLVKDRCAAFENPTLYKSTVDSLQYITLARLKIAFSINKLSFSWCTFCISLASLQMIFEIFSVYSQLWVTILQHRRFDNYNLFICKSGIRFGWYKVSWRLLCLLRKQSNIMVIKEASIIPRSTAKSEYGALASTASKVL